MHSYMVGASTEFPLENQAGGYAGLGGGGGFLRNKRHVKSTPLCIHLNAMSKRENSVTNFQ